MHKHSITARAAGKLLQVLGRELPLLPLDAIRLALKNRDIRINGQRVNQNLNVQAGDEIVLFTPAAGMDIAIHHEDADCLVLTKPAGLNTDDNSRSGASLLAWARQRAGTGESPALVHRLDNQTSGLLVLAKHAKAEEELGRLIRAGGMTKQYTCLVKGCPQPEAAIKAAWLVKDARNARVQVLAQERQQAKKIVTEYQVLERAEASRLLVSLHTGRTHQIRAHLAFLGHPILGDDLYGDWQFNKQHKAKSLMLCASSLGFDDSCRLSGLAGRTFRINAPF